MDFLWNTEKASRTLLAYNYYLLNNIVQVFSDVCSNARTINWAITVSFSCSPSWSYLQFNIFSTFQVICIAFWGFFKDNKHKSNFPKGTPEGLQQWDQGILIILPLTSKFNFSVFCNGSNHVLRCTLVNLGFLFTHTLYL